ncbi:chain-length determining protein [Brevundimonas intermedia]|uniref:chain-length determining protein n=1 Tax=Brevundimonas intermedia TaxID=74315 RepID=UPI003208A3F6
MSDAELKYLGPVPKALTATASVKPWWRRIPLAFLIVVVAPTVLATVYYTVLASPRYVSEARFIVRAPSQGQPSSLGVALQGVGLSSGPVDSFAVHEFINSRDGLRQAMKLVDVKGIFAERGADVFSRFPRPFEKPSEETLFKTYQRFIEVGYDSTTGISTLRVEAFRPGDAQRLSSALLTGGEGIVNALNERAQADAVAEAAKAQVLARDRLAAAQAKLVSFRNTEGLIDPRLAVEESGAIISSLQTTVANLKAERERLASEAPSSPQLPSLSGQISAYESQIQAERAKMTGNSQSLAPRISEYEDLTLEREFAGKELTQANAAMLSAEQDARRQRLYLERIVNPNLPDTSTEPRRLRAIITILFSTLLAYGVGWLMWAGVREHKQH